MLYTDIRYALLGTIHTWDTYNVICQQDSVYHGESIFGLLYLAESKVRFPDLSGAKPPCQNILKYWVGNNDNTCMGQLEQLLIRISCYLHVIQINIVAMRHVCPYIYKV